MTSPVEPQPLPTVDAGLCDQKDVDAAVWRAANCYRIWVKEGYPAYCPMEARVIVKLANQLEASRSRSPSEMPDDRMAEVIQIIDDVRKRLMKAGGSLPAGSNTRRTIGESCTVLRRVVEANQPPLTLSESHQ